MADVITRIGVMLLVVAFGIVSILAFYAVLGAIVEAVIQLNG